LYNVTNIVSDASKDAASDFCFMELDEVCVAGRSQAIKIFELLGVSGEVSAAKLAMAEAFTEALQAYRSKHWDLAERLFSQLLTSCDNAVLPKVFLERINYFQSSPPPDDWGGVHIFGKK
jgi:adenylate cyclase